MPGAGIIMMMKSSGCFRAFLLAGLVGFPAGGLAQRVELPPFLQDMDGLVYEGQASGMDLYTVPGLDGLWLVAPDGRTGVFGTVFSARGRDIGSAFTGREPIRSFEIGETATGEAVQGSEGSGVEIPQVETFSPAGEIAGLGLSPIGLELVDSPDLPVELDVVGQDRGSSEFDGSVGTASDALISGEGISAGVGAGIDAAVVTSEAQAALEGLTFQDKEVLMGTLVEMLRAVNTPEEFKATVSIWTNEVVRQYRENISSGDFSVDMVESTLNSVESEVSPVVLNEVEVASADRLLKEMRHEAFWFNVGNDAAPTVYAFIDPVCPYCAKAVVNIGDEVTSGRLRLRVALVPVVSRESPGQIASILTDEVPPVAFMEHEYAKAEGQIYLEPGDWNVLSEDWQTSILGNVDMMKKYGVKGVPFFVFDTPEGARVVNGVAEVSDFVAALPDAFVPDFR